MKKTITRCGHFDIPARLATEEDSLPPLAPELTPRAYKVYPYALQELYAEKHEVKSFRTLELENDFLHVFHKFSFLLSFTKNYPRLRLYQRMKIYDLILNLY